jgi:isochorismate pyruvate lyase
MAPRKAEDCADMEQVRAEIDRIDIALVDLIGERFTYVDRAWQLKQSPAEARVPWRIQQVINRVRVRAKEKGLPPIRGREALPTGRGRRLEILVMPSLAPGIHAVKLKTKTWMAGTSPAMTSLE